VWQRLVVKCAEQKGAAEDVVVLVVLAVCVGVGGGGCGCSGDIEGAWDHMINREGVGWDRDA
jgi:hypothetical protein